MAADEEWVWNRARGYRPLARFASVKALRGLGLLERDAYEALAADAQKSGGVREAVRTMTGRVYDQLRSKNYPYAAPLGYYGDEQRIRDPGAIHQGAGTCLDLSLLFAAMCAGAGLRVFVVILEDREDGDHALVMIDLASAPPGVGGPGEGGRSGREAPVVPEMASAHELGVRRLVPGPEPVTLTADGLAVEVTAACGEVSAGFAKACGMGAAAVTDRGYRKVHLVDVLFCHDRDGEAPLPARRPAIYPSLPPMPPFHGYESREKTEQELREAVGTVVILGEPGTGKSMLAHHVASRVDHGCGWFLDASSEQALTVALATAEAQAAGQPEQSVDGPELRRLARAALSRLRKADGPWAVVLDNANQDPGSLKSLPRPAPERGQLLVITTVNPKWDRSQDQVVPLPGLEPDEVEERLDAAGVPVTAIAGRPLFVDVSQRFHEATGRWWWEGHPVADLTAAAVPALFWAAVAREVDSGPANAVAQAMSWLPPVRIPVAALESVQGSDRVRDIVARLRRLGLVDAAAGDVTMHRLFRSAVRESALLEEESAQAVLVTRLLSNEPVRRVMESAADLDSAREMAQVLDASPDADSALAALYELARLFERHGTASDSAEWYEKFAHRAGWRSGGDVPGDLLLHVVNALVGMARAAMRGLSGEREDPQHRPVVAEAIRWTEEAERLCRDQDGIDYARAASHAKAMRGLLLRKRASLEQDSAVKLDFLQQAELALRQSYEERQRQFEDPVTSPELDRSQFNLAGLEIRLAQADSEDSAAQHLAAAWHHYTEVLDTRRKRYRTDELEEVACCVNGQAIAAYYQAVLLKGTWAEKAAQLRAAASHAAEAVAIRQGLAGTADDLNTSKSLVLQAKIALARLTIMEGAGIRGDRDDQAIKAYQKEKQQLLGQLGENQ